MDKDDVIYIYAQKVLLSHEKKNEVLLFSEILSSNTDGSGDNHAEWKPARERQVSYDIIYIQNLKRS